MNLLALLTLEKLIKLEFATLNWLSIALSDKTKIWCDTYQDIRKACLEVATTYHNILFQPANKYYAVSNGCDSSEAFTLSLPLANNFLSLAVIDVASSVSALLQPININNECYTPSWFIEPIRNFAGTFHLDPFSCDKANEIVKAENYLWESINGLSYDWLEYSSVDYPNFWVNPPYSRDLIAKCVEKTLSYVGKAEIFLLVNSSTSSKWYQKCVAKCNAVLFPSKRIQFHNPYKEMKHRNEYDQTLFYFGKHPYRFRSQCQKLGSVFTEGYQ